MKLKGSLTEQRIREELVASQQAVFEQRGYPKLARELRARFPHIRSAFVLAWTPEQLEDLFDVLVNGEQVVSVEIPKSDAPPILSVCSVDDYARQIRGRPNQLKLAIAVDLARSAKS